MSARDKSNIVHQDLIHAVLRGGGYAQVARTLSSALERSTVVVDNELRPLVTSSGEQITTVPLSLPRAVSDAIDQSRRSGRCTFVADNSETVIQLVSAVTAGESFLGGHLAESFGRADRPPRRTPDRGTGSSGHCHPRVATLGGGSSGPACT